MNVKTVKKREVSFVSGSIPKALLAFSGPFILGVLVQNLYGAVDLFVVGHFATTADVSAVTIGSQLMTIVTQLIIGFATGITMLVGQSCGAQDKKGIAKTVGSSVMLFGVVAAALTAGYLAFHKQMVSAMQTPSEAVLETEQYLFICALGIVFIIGYNVISSILTGMGDSKTPFIFVLVACLINVVLDVLFVNGLGWGARGAAIATTVAQAGSFIFSLLFLRRKGLGFPLSKTDFRFDKAQIGSIVRIGGPVALQNVLVNASFLFITAIINMMGVVASAAVGVVEKLITFLFVPATAMGTSVGAASAQNIGANQMDRARKSMWWGVVIALVPAVIFTIICQFYGAGLTGILSGDEQVVALAANYLRSYILDILLVSFVFCMNGYFNSYGKSWFSLVHSVVTTFAVRVPMAFLLSRMEGATLFDIGWAAPASTAVSLVMCLIFLSRMKPLSAPQTTDLPLPKKHSGPQHFVVTISREYGSGGRQIGESVAEKLGIAFYNRNLIDLTAKRSGLAEDYITNWEERISSQSIWGSPGGGRGTGSPWFGKYYSNTDIMFNTQSQIIRELAEKEACVIVGRCADYILRDYSNCVNVFIHADLEHRAERITTEYGASAKKAAETAENTDKGRANYYRYYTGGQWGSRAQYHLMIDSARFGIEESAEIIADSIRKLFPDK
ncbi:MATE family efflux transporter [Christensenellaceae bacterium OttesenSCG-928-K19]|nr:MATE family efflux transporter [Christensenellaceae bacterium OttesenSCG-928-K19]